MRLAKYGIGVYMAINRSEMGCELGHSEIFLKPSSQVFFGAKEQGSQVALGLLTIADSLLWTLQQLRRGYG